MMLGPDFRYAHLVRTTEVSKSSRRVRDSAYWNAPVGTPITPAMRAAKKAQRKPKKKPQAPAKGQGQGSKAPATPAKGSAAPKDTPKPGGKEYANLKRDFHSRTRKAKTGGEIMAILADLKDDTTLTDEHHEAAINEARSAAQKMSRVQLAQGLKEAREKGDGDAPDAPRKADQPNPKTVRPPETPGKPTKVDADAPPADADKGDPAPEGGKKTSAADHLKNGGGLGDTPDTTGLWDAIKADPQRFQQKAVEMGQVAEVMRITDKKTGETWYGKTIPRPEVSGNPDHDPKDADREFLAHAIAAEDSVQVADVKVEYRPDGTAVVISRDVGQIMGGKENKKLAARAKEMMTKDNAPILTEKEQAQIGMKIAEGEDPGQAMRLALFDYLIGNRLDRHIGNVKFLDNDDGSMSLGVFDHGLAFEQGWESGQTDADPMDWFSLYSGFSPNGVKWDGMPKDEADSVPRMGWNLASIIFHTSGSREDLVSDFDAAIEGFEKIDVNSLLDRLPGSLGTKRDAEQKRWAESVKQRVEILKQSREEFLDMLEGNWRQEN